MQCVSRFVYGETVWVLNLTTMKETQASWKALEDYVRRGGAVEGASIVDGKLRVEPYQFDTSPDVVRSVLVDKTFYQVLNNKLVYLDTPCEEVHLSKYAPEICSGSIVPRPKCKYIIDSNISKVESLMFRFVEPKPYLDIREASDSVALSVYRDSLAEWYTLQDDSVRRNSLQSVVAVENKVFWMGRIVDKFQDFAFEVLEDKLLSNFPSEKTRNKVYKRYHEYYSGVWHWHVLCKSVRRGEFFSALDSNPGLISRSEYESLVRSLVYVNSGGNYIDVIEALDWFFSGGGE